MNDVQLYMTLPRLYPIIDLAGFASASDPVLAASRFAEALLEGGATLLQLRDKTGDMRRFLSCARELRRITRGRASFIINDRADLCLAADADGVHLGQDDLSPEAVRSIFAGVECQADPSTKSNASTAPTQPVDGVDFVDAADSQRFCSNPLQSRLLIGFSTHSVDQAELADRLPVDYVAIGPVFATSSKANPDPIIGLEGIGKARAATSKPLVAIGGITRANCRQVVEAGADSVAVISDLLGSPAKAVEEFMHILE
jgi:thiamine-phosphate pyrophosphorylase